MALKHITYTSPLFGAIVRLSVRRVLLQLSSAYPWKDIYTHAFHALRC